MRKGVIVLIAALGCLWCEAGASVLTPDGRDHFKRGRELYALGRWADAKQEFAAVCGAVPQPESFSASWLLKTCLPYC